MVRQSGPNEGDDHQGRKFCDPYLQSSVTVASIAGRSCRSQSAACSCDAGPKSRRRAEYTCTQIAPRRAAGITTVNSFARVAWQPTHTWHDSAEPKNHEGIGRGRHGCICEAVACRHGPSGPSLRDGISWRAANASRRRSRRLTYQPDGPVLRNTGRSCLDFSGPGSGRCNRCPTDP